MASVYQTPGRDCKPFFEDILASANRRSIDCRRREWTCTGQSGHRHRVTSDLLNSLLHQERWRRSAELYPLVARAESVLCGIRAIPRRIKASLLVVGRRNYPILHPLS
jgi:hypothetical protein